jgi:hypothetical protein
VIFDRAFDPGYAISGLAVKLFSIFVVAGVLVLAASGRADAYWRRYGPGPRYDAAYIGSVEYLGYRGRRYGLGGPAYAFGDPAYGGCRRGRELVPNYWGPRWVSVRLCPAGSGPYRSRYYY